MLALLGAAGAVLSVAITVCERSPMSPRRGARRRALALMGAGATALVITPAMSSPAAAFDPPLLLPFSEGQTWNICYAYDEGSHRSTYALDLTLATGVCAPGENKSANEPAKSPGNGVIRHRWKEGVCVDLDGVGAFKVAHISPSVAVGDRVRAGQTLGSVNPAGIGANAGIAHMHVEAYDIDSCPTDVDLDGTGAIPFDDAHKARFRCARNLYYGPDWTTTESGVQLTRQSGDCAPILDDILMLGQDGAGMQVTRLMGNGPALRDFNVSSVDRPKFDPDPSDSHFVAGDFDNDRRVDDFAVAAPGTTGGVEIKVWYDGGTTNQDYAGVWATLADSLNGFEGRMAIASLDRD